MTISHWPVLTRYFFCVCVCVWDRTRLKVVSLNVPLHFFEKRKQKTNLRLLLFLLFIFAPEAKPASSVPLTKTLKPKKVTNSVKRNPVTARTSQLTNRQTSCSVNIEDKKKEEEYFRNPKRWLLETILLILFFFGRTDTKPVPVSSPQKKTTDSREKKNKRKPSAWPSVWKTDGTKMNETRLQSVVFRLSPTAFILCLVSLSNSLYLPIFLLFLARYVYLG